MENINYDDSKKDLPVDQLYRIFKLVGWMDEAKTTPEMLKNFNLPFINSTLVISAWKNDKLIGVVRVLSDKMFRSIIYDLAVDPEFHSNGIGRNLIKRCIEHYPKSEWLVGTEEHIAGFYEKIGFKRFDDRNGVILGIPPKFYT